jgi:hypothetical protein
MLSNRTHSWFISHVPQGVKPGTNKDVDFYAADPMPGIPFKPPEKGWRRCSEGADPPPNLRKHNNIDAKEDNYSVVASVNETRYTSFEQGKRLLLEAGTDKRLKMIHFVFAEIFFNPALSIDLGLFDVLKFQIEELKLDVNYQLFAGILFRQEHGERYEAYFEGRSLLFHALAQPDERLFDYLLSLQGIEANPVLEHAINGQHIRDVGFTLLHEMSLLANYALLDEKIDLVSRVRRILEQEEVDVNCRDDVDATPLQKLCEFWVDYVRRPRLRYDLARLYLSVVAGELDRAKGFLEHFLRDWANHHNDAEHNECCRKLIDLLIETQKKRDAEEH